MENAIELIKEFEGFRAKAYKCPAGVWTIGYGFTDDVEEGDVITKAEALLELRKYVLSIRINIITYVKTKLNINQLDALTSFVYNVGLYAFRKSSVLMKINLGDMTGASEVMLKYNKVNGKVLAGLTRRRKAEVKLFLTPVH